MAEEELRHRPALALLVDEVVEAGILRGSGFGIISKTAGSSRQIQFSLKLIY